MAHDGAHHFGVDLAREVVVVAQDLADQFAAVHGEVLGPIGVPGDIGDEVATLDRRPGPGLGQLGIGVTNVAGDRGRRLDGVVAQIADGPSSCHALLSFNSGIPSHKP